MDPHPSATETQPAPATAHFRHIACCFDGAPADERAIQCAQRLRGEGARLSIVHVVPGPPLADALDGTHVETVDDVTQAERRSLERRTARIPGAEAVLLRGLPGRAICRWADDAACDLLIVSARQPGRWGMSVLGGVTRHLVNHAPCAVLVVRHDGDRAITEQR